MIIEYIVLHNGPSARYNNQIYSMACSVKKALKIISIKDRVGNCVRRFLRLMYSVMAQATELITLKD